VIDWIKETLDPPGADKKNRFAVFKTIGDVFGRVRTDAVKAFNAHFPYLADENKLQQHGKALFIPRLTHDRPDDFRNRVAAASFFLMRAGERGFIIDLLKERFNDRFEIIEKFLQIHTKVADLTIEERAWIIGLLDSLVDPNVSFELSQWLNFKDAMPLSCDDSPHYKINRADIERFGNPNFRDGTHFRDGSVNRRPGGFLDEFKINITRGKFFRDGAYKRDGSIPNRHGGRHDW